MRGWLIVGILGLSMSGIDIVGAQGCFPTSANPATLNVFSDPLTGNVYYLEERGNPLGTVPPVPGSGYLFGQGTWLYQETNTIWDLQRGGIGFTGTCFPPGMSPCLLIGEDPIIDVNCGAGPDTLIAGGTHDPIPPIGGLPTVQIDAPGPTILAVSLVQTSSVVVGCVGTVQITVAGASLPVPGISLSPSGCASPPCEPYSSVSIPCAANPIGCCFTLFAVVPSGSADVACVRESAVRVDVNNDGFWDVILPAATLTGPPC